MRSLCSNDVVQLFKKHSTGVGLVFHGATGERITHMLSLHAVRDSKMEMRI
jgi:hypothetical protein